MAKSMTIEVCKQDIIETPKAYGFPYSDKGSWNSNSVIWLPKSQITLTGVTYDMYKDAYGEFEANHYWQDCYVWVDVPMWLAREHGYFDRCIFHA